MNVNAVVLEQESTKAGGVHLQHCNFANNRVQFSKYLISSIKRNQKGIIF
jgi:hypothetical protein